MYAYIRKYKISLTHNRDPQSGKLRLGSKRQKLSLNSKGLRILIVDTVRFALLFAGVYAQSNQQHFTKKGEVHDMGATVLKVC